MNKATAIMQTINAVGLFSLTGIFASHGEYLFSLINLILGILVAMIAVRRWNQVKKHK